MPHKDNISYFGNGGDEADLHLSVPAAAPCDVFPSERRMRPRSQSGSGTLDLPSDRVTYFNFLSSHDGIGVRPVEGILDEEARQLLVDAALAHGGEVSYKDNGDGTKSPYELNINYQDALAGPDAFGFRRGSESSWRQRPSFCPCRECRGSISTVSWDPGMTITGKLLQVFQEGSTGRNWILAMCAASLPGRATGPGSSVR